MQHINIHDAKTNLSKYLEQIANTHEAIIICNNGKTVAQLREYKKKKTRRLGLCKGQITMSDDFDEIPDEFMDYFG